MGTDVGESNCVGIFLVGKCINSASSTKESHRPPCAESKNYRIIRPIFRVYCITLSISLRPFLDLAYIFINVAYEMQDASITYQTEQENGAFIKVDNLTKRTKNTI